MDLAYVQWANVANEYFYFSHKKWMPLELSSWTRETIRADALSHIKRLAYTLVAHQATCSDGISVVLMQNLWFSVSRAFVTSRRCKLLDLDIDPFEDL